MKNLIILILSLVMAQVNIEAQTMTYESDVAYTKSVKDTEFSTPFMFESKFFFESDVITHVMNHATATFKILSFTNTQEGIEYNCIDDNDQPVTITVTDVVENGLVNITIDYSMAKKNKRPSRNNVILSFSCWTVN